MSNVEDQIRRAMEGGKFDNLPGSGKPLRLEENPFEDPEWRLAHHALRSSGYSLPWIETRKELDEAIRAARAALRRTWAWQQAALADELPPGFVQAVWDQAVDTFRQRVENLNRRIRDYNIEAPSPGFHLNPLHAEREIEKTTRRTPPGGLDG
jgi:DnaJ family protein C protein 28